MRLELSDSLLASISLSGAAMTQPQKLNFTIELDAPVSISAIDAQRSVTGWLLDNVGHLAMADAPHLLLGTRTAWRVPVLLTTPRTRATCGYAQAAGSAG